MAKQIDKRLNDSMTSSEQIEIIESIEYIHSAELQMNELLKLRSLNAFTKRYFENEFCDYVQTISVRDGTVICKAFLNGQLISEARAQSFNHARTKAAILALQDRNFELLKSWLDIHKQDLKAYLSV